jgi:hypothetical protein
MDAFLICAAVLAGRPNFMASTIIQHLLAYAGQPRFFVRPIRSASG